LNKKLSALLNTGKRGASIAHTPKKQASSPFINNVTKKKKKRGKRENGLHAEVEVVGEPVVRLAERGERGRGREENTLERFTRRSR